MHIAGEIGALVDGGGGVRRRLRRRVSMVKEESVDGGGGVRGLCIKCQWIVGMG